MGLRPILYSLLMWATLIYAMRRGGWAERSAAWVMVIDSVLSATADGDYREVQATMMIYDGLTFSALFAIGLFCERFWALWVAAMAGLALLAHLLPLMPLSNPAVYHDAIALWSWPILLVNARATYQRSLEAKAKTT